MFSIRQWDVEYKLGIKRGLSFNLLQLVVFKIIDEMIYSHYGSRTVHQRRAEGTMYKVTVPRMRYETSIRAGDTAGKPN